MISLDVNFDGLVVNKAQIGPKAVVLVLQCLTIVKKGHNNMYLLKLKLISTYCET
jgi:hypothetical protein